MKNIGIFALLLYCSGALAWSIDDGAAGPTDAPGAAAGMSVVDVRQFDLHDPEVMSSWTAFLASTPMLNEEPLPPSLQARLTSVVATYRYLTPVDRPAFFVATYVDLLSEHLLAAEGGAAGGIFPTKICPVFASGEEASVSSLLALASGLPGEIFENAPGRPERYRELFLETEFSHCRFLANLSASVETRLPVSADEQDGAAFVRLSFNVGAERHTAILQSREELRALLESVGDVDAISTFRQQAARRDAADETEILSYLRLLALLATNKRNGYAAVPVLAPLLSEKTNGPRAGATETLRIADALEIAYRGREAFARIVPFAIRNTAELQAARISVSTALAGGGESEAIDHRVRALLQQFVTGADLLLPPATL